MTDLTDSISIEEIRIEKQFTATESIINRFYYGFYSTASNCNAYFVQYLGALCI